MSRWAAASQRRVLEIPMRWVLHRGKKAIANMLRSYESHRLAQPNLGEQKWMRRPRLCLGLFEAAEELSVGFVHGVKPSLYLERLNAEVLKDLGLSGNARTERRMSTYAFPEIENAFFAALSEGRASP